MTSLWLAVPGSRDTEAIQPVQLHGSAPTRKSVSSTSIQLDPFSSYNFSKDDTVPAKTTRLNSRNKYVQFNTILVDLGVILLSLAFSGFILFIASTHNQPIDDRYDYFQNVLTILASAFPIVFALILGRLFSQIARWRLEQGTTLGLLEQLIGSRTLGATLTTLFQLRTFNLLGLSLVIVWSFSPIGGQSLLRILHVEPRGFNSTGYYFNTWKPQVFLSRDFFNDAAFCNALFAPQSIRQGPMDFWGNPKIPFLDSLGDATDRGWSEVANTSQLEYSSLIGIPTSNISAGNTSFSIESTYMHLECEPFTVHALNRSAHSFHSQETVLNETLRFAQLTNSSSPHIANGTWYGFQQNGTTGSPARWNLALNRFVDTLWWDAYHERSLQFTNVNFGIFENETAIETGPTHLLFQARVNLTTLVVMDDDGNLSETVDAIEVVKTKCRVRQKYVESHVSCSRVAGLSRGDCGVIAQRTSKRPYPPEDLLSISLPSEFRLLSERLPKLFMSQDANALNDPLIIYLFQQSLDELNSHITDPDLKTVKRAAFSTRLSQLINSYMLLSKASMLVMPQFFENEAWLAQTQVAGPMAMETETTDFLFVYTISWPWMAVCIISCAVLLIGSILGVFYTHIVRGPELLGFVSSIFRDSRYVDVPLGTENVGGLELSKIMKGERFRYGFTRDSQGGVGRVGIAHEEQVEDLVS